MPDKNIIAVEDYFKTTNEKIDKKEDGKKYLPLLSVISSIFVFFGLIVILLDKLVKNPIQLSPGIAPVNWQLWLGIFLLFLGIFLVYFGISHKKSKKKNKLIFKIIGNILLFIIKVPYYLFYGLYFSLYRIFKTIRKTYEYSKDVNKKEIRKRDNAQYEKLEIIKKETGDLKRWESSFYSAESKIGIILGARGSGKTAFGIKLMENAHTHSDKKCYAIGFQEKEMPSWIKVISNIGEIENDSLVLIDEGGVLFSSRKSMTAANKMLSALILVSRHKNISILFISQNSSNLDVNIIRQADFLILKPSSLLQKDFERKIIGKLYESLSEEFSKLKTSGLTYIYSDGFRGFVKNTLPSFWKTSISKSFR